ncbi:MAG: sensor histidine kinase [Eubacteriales bacterium]|nr:sensor histidine kinase [Eubacteriales bacterium]
MGRNGVGAVRRWFQKLHVYVQLALVCAVSAVLLLVFFGLNVKRATDNARGTLEEYGKGMMEQLENTVATNYTSYSKILRLISFDKDVQAFLLNDDDAQRVDLHSALKRALIEVATLNANITDIVIEDTQGRLYNLSDSLLPLPGMDLSNNMLRVSGFQSRKQGSVTTDYLVIGKGIYSIDSYNQTNQFIGNAYLTLSTVAFVGDIRADLDTELLLYLTDADGVLLWANAADATQTLLDQARRDPSRLYYYVDEALERTGYHIYAMQPEAGDVFSLASRSMEEPIAFVTLAAALILLWIVWARNLVKPLGKLRRFINRLQGGSLSALDSRVTLAGYREAEVIGNEFNTLLGRTQQLTDELVRTNTDLYESQLLAKQSELSNLRSQINPHFLYNTLETMVGIAYTNNQPELAAIARSLSIIFKFSIKGDSIVPLKTEWKIAMSYIDIQHYRFSDRFDVSYSLAPECENVLVPKLILQPMIENAVVHGIEQQSGFCHLRVSAASDGRLLRLTVADDGAGIDAETLRELQQSLSGGARTDETKHIGILNVDSRIKLQYGREYGVSLESVQGEGTTVTITLPVQKEEQSA